MTCIVALRDDMTVYMGGDSLGTEGNRIHSLASPKVFYNGPYLMATCGSFRLRDVLAYSFQPPKPPLYAAADETHRFMATTFIDAVRECFKESGYAMAHDEQEDYDGKFLVAWRGGELWYVDGDYQVGAFLTDYAAIGAGEGVAVGAMFVTPRLKPTKRILRALEAAEYHDATVRRPFHVLSI
jgi:ATP-dependent protease HslVU (ClpYQ) peptidase subunit